jgi:RHS repeat-associated protein
MKTQMRSLLWALALLFLLSPTNLASAYYDPAAQRWLNRDPLGEEGLVLIGEEGGCNLYGFDENEPLSLYDAYGLVPDDGNDGRINPHRKKKGCKWQKHSAAQGRPKAGARSGKIKPNMAQNKGCGCGGALSALLISICEMQDMYPGLCPPLPDEDGECPEPYTAVRHKLPFGFYYITCESLA